jgi:hypothetical protein
LVSSPESLEIARSLNDPTLDDLLDSRRREVTVTLAAGRFTVAFPPDVVAALREKIAATAAGW